MGSPQSIKSVKNTLGSAWVSKDKKVCAYRGCTSRKGFVQPCPRGRYNPPAWFFEHRVTRSVFS